MTCVNVPEFNIGPSRSDFHVKIPIPCTFVLGSVLLHDYGVETQAQDPRINYVPWIIINGEFTQENKKHLNSLFQLETIVLL